MRIPREIHNPSSCGTLAARQCPIFGSGALPVHGRLLPLAMGPRTPRRCRGGEALGAHPDSVHLPRDGPGWSTDLSLGLARSLCFPFYYDANPWPQSFSIPSIAHGSMRLASLAAGVATESPDDPTTLPRHSSHSKPARAPGSGTEPGPMTTMFSRFSPCRHAKFGVVPTDLVVHRSRISAS